MGIVSPETHKSKAKSNVLFMGKYVKSLMFCLLLPKRLSILTNGSSPIACFCIPVIKDRLRTSTGLSLTILNFQTHKLSKEEVPQRDSEATSLPSTTVQRIKCQLSIFLLSEYTSSLGKSKSPGKYSMEFNIPSTFSSRTPTVLYFQKSMRGSTSYENTLVSMWLAPTSNTCSLSSDFQPPEKTPWDFKKLDPWVAKTISTVRG